MQTRGRSIFATIRSEGALLPTDLLQRVINGDRDLPGVTPDAYHLNAGEKLNEATNRAWNRLVGAWVAFTEVAAKLPAGDPGTTVTRERWLLPLFSELGYGRLLTAKAHEVEGKTYSISHGWQHTPMHLVGCRVDLDRRAAGVAGASRSSPHGLVQELLNRSDAHLWGIVSNGLRLRMLRDNSSLTRQAYVEFDLEAMMTGEVYADFVLLWLMCHESRVEAEHPETCWLEQWSKAAQEQGTRALDQLRKGVEEAITNLGRGFLAHPANQGLCDSLRSGTLEAQEYYRQLLRLVYRLLFLFVAEDRDLLCVPHADPAARERYTRFYSTARLRRLAERRVGTRHADLFHGLRLVMQKLGSDAGCPELALPALGSLLFSDQAIPALDLCEIANHELLGAIRALAFSIDGNSRRIVDYKNLGSEELGSVYESLLELHPVLHLDAGTFELKTAGGHERKTTGSYYTPTSLIQCLLDSALDPVLEEAARQDNPEAAILKLKICDPACGSGHFLIAAAHRVAKQLAAVRTGDEEPSPEAIRTALRDVIGHCIYGVDLNPMAVELCKVSLWMEALEPGKPLSFLDHRIQCGNSLLGATPALLLQGIPDEAFDPIEGDDKEICKKFRKQSKEERGEGVVKRGEGRVRGQMPLFDAADQPWQRLGDLATGLLSLEAIPDDTIEGIRRKQERYEELVRSSGYLYGTLWADAWCAAFVWKKTKEFPYPVTEEAFRRIERNPFSVAPWMRDEIHRLARQYQFFHWHLAFPDVFRLPTDSQTPENEQAGWSGGFDVFLGNPPWDTLSPDAKEFFSTYDPEVRFQDREGQSQIIAQLLQDRGIAERWNTTCRELYAQVQFFKNSRRYLLFAPGNLGKGDFNVYRMFVESALQTVREGGRLAQIVPEGLYNGANCMAIRQALFDKCNLEQILGFENAREVWFKGIDSRTKFCIYSARKGGNTIAFQAAFNIRTPEQLIAIFSGNGLALPVSLVQEFSPDALAIMELGSQLDIDIATKMYKCWPKFGDELAGPPHRRYMAEIHMGNDRELFEAEVSGFPLYEGRMVDQFDYRAKGYRSGRGRAAEWEDLLFGDSTKSIQPQWYIPIDRIPEKTRERVNEYRIGFCDVGSPTNERTLAAALIPPRCLCGDKVPTITFEPEYEWAYLVWLAIANSFAMDFLARKKVSLKISYTILDSLPFPRLASDDPRVVQLLPLALRLTSTGPEMADFWNAMAKLGWVDPVPGCTMPPGFLDEDKRLEARAQLDVVVARDIFGLSRDEIAYILETFPIVKRKEEQKYGGYRSKRLILEIYDSVEERRLSSPAFQSVS